MGRRREHHRSLIELALSTTGKYRVASECLDKHGRVLSRATNSYTKTHPSQRTFARQAGLEAKQYLHAEIAALVRCKGSRPYKIRIIRVNRNGELRMAKPCPICQLAIKESGIKIVEHSV